MSSIVDIERPKLFYRYCWPFFCLLSLLFAANSVAVRILSEWQKSQILELVLLVGILAGYFLMVSKPIHGVSFIKNKCWLNHCSNVVLLAFSLTMLVGDYLVEEEMLLVLGIWSGLLAIARIWLGHDRAEIATFPFLLLLYSIPVPRYVFFNHLIAPLQRLSALWTGGMLKALGYIASVEGTTINIGAGSMRIVEECSGIRFLTAISIISLICGRLWFARFFKLRAFLFVLSIPVAIVTNVTRLTAAGIIQHRYSPGEAIKFIHSNSVFVFYALAILSFLLIARLMGEIVSNADLTETDHQQTIQPVKAFCAPRALKIFVTCLWLIIVGIIGTPAQQTDSTRFFRNGLAMLKIVPANWQSIGVHQNNMTENIISGLKDAPQNLKETVKSPSGFVFEVEIVWWPGRRPRNRLIVFHQAIVCPTGKYAAAIHGQRKLGNAKVAWSVLPEKEPYKYLCYWLQSKNKISDRPYVHVIWQYLQELKLEPADGCFVMIGCRNIENKLMSSDLTSLTDHIQQTLQDWFTGKF